MEVEYNYSGWFIVSTLKRVNMFLVVSGIHIGMTMSVNLASLLIL